MPDSEDYEKIKDINEAFTEKDASQCPRHKERKCESFLFDMTGEMMHEYLKLKEYKRRARLKIIFLLLIIACLLTIMFLPAPCVSAIKDFIHTVREVCRDLLNLILH